MAKTTCKLCSRRFASPRALAGHMRAHSIAAAKSQISSASSGSTSVVAGADDDADARKGYVLREKPKRRVRLAESDFSDRESETTAGFPPPSSPAASAKHAAGSADAEPPVSSVSDGATPEEDVALSLMMLSRDRWPSPPPPPAPLPSYSDDSGDDARPIAQKRTRYECPACKKAFRSYQALGGHRASNVRGGKGGCCAAPPPMLSTPPPSPMQQKQPLPAYGEGAWKLQPHQCPHCFRVFSSGQALGGHRRSHHCSAADPPVAMKSLGFIDLNLPATLDDVELSAVSDPFLSSKPGS